LDVIYELIDEDLLPAVKIAVESLRGQIGDDPELIRAEALIHRKVTGGK
jgi:hypothetical protein